MTFRARSIMLVAMIGSVAPAVAVQTPVPAKQPQTPAATGTITGAVVDGSSAEAIGGAIVFLAPVEPGRTIPVNQTRQATDGRGRFAFTEIPEGSYQVSASKFGYLDGGYGREFAPTEPLRSVHVRKDEWVSNLRVVVWKPGSISGAVRDEAGEPVVGVFVRALARFRIQGRDDLVAGPVTTTNDRGEYRLRERLEQTAEEQRDEEQHARRDQPGQRGARARAVVDHRLRGATADRETAADPGREVGERDREEVAAGVVATPVASREHAPVGGRLDDRQQEAGEADRQRGAQIGARDLGQAGQR